MKKILLGITLVFVLMLSACGNNTETINVYTRDVTSGTRDGFFTNIGFSDAIKDNSKLVSGYIERASNAEVISAVKNDKNGIGYISLSSLEASGVKGLSYNGVIPSESNVINGSYELIRNFNYITRNEFDNDKEEQIVKAFVAFLNTRDAKETIISKDGIISDVASAVTWDSIKDSYPICNKDNTNITIRFGGSTSVSKIAEALSAQFSGLCGGFIVDHNHTGSSDAYRRTQGSEKDRSDNLHIGFASREFKADSEVASANTAGVICIDAIVAVVNKENSITNITTTNLNDIYAGKITKWNDVK